MKLLKNFILALVISAAGLAVQPVAAQNTQFAPGDLVLYFQKQGGTSTVYANLGNAATAFRGSAPGAGDAADNINFLNISEELTSAFGTDWSIDTTIYAGLAGVWGTASTDSGLQDGDPARTLYVSQTRNSVGVPGQQNSTGWDLTPAGDNGMSIAASDIFGMNNTFEVNYDAKTTLSPTNISTIDDNNPFMSVGIQGTAYRVFVGGVQQAGSASTFGAFGAADTVEFALDLHRILARNDVVGQVGGNVRMGSFEGTVTINSSGQVSFITRTPALPTVSVAVSPSSVTEDGTGTLVYTFTRVGDTTGSLTANFTVSGTAAFTSDYTQTDAASFSTSAGTVTFSAGSSTATVTLDPVADSTVETDETVDLTVTTGSGYTVGSPAAASGTITNDDLPTVSVAVSPSSVTEDGTGTLVYTFTRVGDTTDPLNVGFTVDGTATFTSDYTQSGASSFSATTGKVAFGAGASTATVTLDPVADSTVETDETAGLTVTTGSGYTVGSPAAASGTITNDDLSTVSVAVSPSSVTEDGTGTLVYTFTRVGDTTGSLTANFTVDGTATFTSDYTQTDAASFSASAGTVTFSAGSSTATVTLDPLADSTVETDETADLTVAVGSGYTLGTPRSASGTITNDDLPTVSVAVSPSSVTEDGTGTLVYTFTRVGDTTGSLTANFTVSGTAAFTSDYTQTDAASFSASAGTVTFSAGSSTATVTLDPVVDSTVETDETVDLTVTTGSGYTAGTPAAASGTITNDDLSTVSVAVSPSSVTEDGTGTLVYTFTRVGDTTGSLTANFTVDGTATFTSDYTQSGASSFSATTGKVAFGAGASTATVTLDPLADSTVETDETADLTVAVGSGYTLGTPRSASGTITNDDLPTVSVAVSPSSVTEDGTGTLVYTFTRVGDTTGSLTANFTVSGTAAFTSDYTQTDAASFSASAGTVTFSAGSSTATVTLDPVVDSTVETDETVDLTVVIGSGYTAGTPALASGTITNDDLPTVISDVITHPDGPAPPPTLTPIPLGTVNAGTYVGLLTSSDGSQNFGNFKSFKVSSKGTFSANMMFGGVSYSMKGKFDGSGHYAGVVMPSGGSPATVNLQLVRTSGGARKIEGMVSVDSQTAIVSLMRSGVTALHAGSYTLLIICNSDDELAPRGYGYGLMKVNSCGQATISGMLGDGTRWTAKCHITSDGEMPIYYIGKNGFLAGLVRFRDVAGVSDCDGEVIWRIAGREFDLPCNLIGSRFQKTGGRLLTSIQDAPHNVDLHIGEIPGAQAESLPFEWAVSNRIHYAGTDTIDIKIKITTSTGEFKRESTAAGQAQPKIYGVVFQKQSFAAGLMYFDGSQSRSLIIVPTEP